MQYLIYTLLFLILWVGVRYLLIFQRLGRAVLQYPHYCVKAETEVPEFVKQLFAGTGKQLQDWGFEPCCYARVDLMIVGEKRWQQLWYCDRHQTFAWLSIPALPSPTQAVNVDFETFLADGTLLLTINGRSHYIILPMPATLIQDDYAPHLEQQWQLHAQKVEALAPQNPPRLLSPDSFLELLASHESATLSHALSQKKLSPQDSDHFTLTLATAATAAIQIGNGTQKEAPLTRQRPQVSPPDITIPVEAEVEAYYYLDLWETRQPRPYWKGGILILSLAGFVFLGSFFFDFVTVAILIGVLFLHELGHFSAMRWFGYQDTSIFFLPLLGAAASGRKDNATLTEKVVVLLAGPMPGLILGVLLAVIFQGDRATAWTLLTLWLVLLNFLNLLPVLPLDGGRVLNLLLFSRHPDAEILFKLFTVTALAIAGWSFQDPILLFLTVVMALSLPNNFRSRTILKRLHQNAPGGLSDDKLLQHLFQTLKTCGYDTLPFAQKYRLVKEIAQRYQEPHASWGTRLGLLVLYFCCLVGGFGAIALSVWLNTQSSTFFG